MGGVIVIFVCDVLKYIAGVFGAILAIFSFLTALCRPFKKWVVKNIRKITYSEEQKQENQKQNETILEIKELLTDVKIDIGKISEGTQASLRNQILGITNEVIKRGEITQLEKQNLMDLHKAYTNLNGNSYEHAEYELAMDLEVSDR